MPLREFTVLRWDDLPPGTEVSKTFDLLCDCGEEAICPVEGGAKIEARIGMAFVFDPRVPAKVFTTPELIKCPNCGKIYERGQHVR